MSQTIADIHFSMQIEDDLVVLTDHGSGYSITNGAELVIAELALLLGADFARFRVIYRDTEQDWDGIAHHGDRFIRFVPLRTRDRHVAVDLAKRGVDAKGDPWKK
jgi:hypothetical protein